MSLTLDKASIIVDQTLAKARELGLRPMCVAVLDEGGHLKALKREDGAGILRPAVIPNSLIFTEPMTACPTMSNSGSPAATVFIASASYATRGSRSRARAGKRTIRKETT